MNLLELARAVKRESGLSGGGPASFATAAGDDLRIFNWVIDTWQSIELQHEQWAWRRKSAQATTSGSMILPATAAAPGFALTDFGSWKRQDNEYRPSAYRAADGQQAEQRLTWVEYEVFRRMFMTGVHQPGPLQYWSIAPIGDFLVGPTPDAEHVVRSDYIADAVRMSSEDDVPAMPTRFHDLIVWEALLQYGGYDAASEVVQRAGRNAGQLWPALRQAQLPQPTRQWRPLA